MQVAWGQLQRHYRDRGAELPAELVWCAPQNHAMLAHMCYLWTLQASDQDPKTSTAHRLVQCTKYAKLMPQVRNLWSTGGRSYTRLYLGLV